MFKKSFWASRSFRFGEPCPGEPGLLLKCFGTPLRCPGGLPGTCAAGWDADSVACSACLPGMQPAGEEGFWV